MYSAYISQNLDMVEKKYKHLKFTVTIIYQGLNMFQPSRRWGCSVDDGWLMLDLLLPSFFNGFSTFFFT